MSDKEQIPTEPAILGKPLLANVIVRTKDYDGMGGWEYEYQCCKCKTYVESDSNFCKECGERFDSIHNLDTWGYH